MEARNEDGFAEHVAVHRVDDGGAGVGRLRRHALRHVQLDVERVQLQRLMVIRAGGRAHPHVRVRTQADLTAAVG